jgi:hypothetical protein
MKRVIIAFLIGLAVGFFLGRESVQKETIVRHHKGEKVTGKVERDILNADVEFVTDIKLIPYLYWKQDTIRDTVIIVPDTAAIIDDYRTKRKYNFVVFDDMTGKLVAKPTVLHNRLLNFEYEFTPIYKHTITTKEKTIQPFISTSFNTFSDFGIGGGIFYHNIGIEYQYMRDIKYGSDGHGVGIKVKF